MCWVSFLNPAYITNGNQFIYDKTLRGSYLWLISLMSSWSAPHLPIPAPQGTSSRRLTLFCPRTDLP